MTENQIPADEAVPLNDAPPLDVTLRFVRRDGTHGFGASGNGPELQPPYPNEQFMGRYDPEGDPQWSAGWPLPHVYVRVTEDFYSRWLAARDVWGGVDESGVPIPPPPLLPTAADVLEPSVY